MIRRPPRSTLVPDAALCRSWYLPPCSSSTAASTGRLAAKVRGTAIDRGSVAARPCGRGSMTQQGDSDWSHEHSSEEHTSELQSRQYLVCRLLLQLTSKPASS